MLRERLLNKNTEKNYNSADRLKRMDSILGTIGMSREENLSHDHHFADFRMFNSFAIKRCQLPYFCALWNLFFRVLNELVDQNSSLFTVLNRLVVFLLYDFTNGCFHQIVSKFIDFLVIDYSWEILICRK